MKKTKPQKFTIGQCVKYKSIKGYLYVAKLDDPISNRAWGESTIDVYDEFGHIYSRPKRNFTPVKSKPPAHIFRLSTGHLVVIIPGKKTFDVGCSTFSISDFNKIKRALKQTST